MSRFPFVFFILASFAALSQVGPGTWQDHKNINSCNSVTKLGTKIYASYGNGLIYFEESEIAPKSLNKINGLSDVGIRLLRANAYSNKVLVVYENCNLDVLDADGHISNYPDFKLKTFSGRKIVNEVTFDKNIAYLSCGFGIVVFDMERMEIRETYLIGANATNVDVLQVAVADTLLFAACEDGIYKASRSANLSNYKNWHRDTVQVPKGYYRGVVNVSGQVLCVYTPNNDTISKADSIYHFINNGWQKYAPLALNHQTIRKIGATYGELFYVLDEIGLMVREVSTGRIVEYNASFNGETDYGTQRDAWYSKDHTGNISYWIADARFGLYQTYGYYPYAPQSKVTRNGVNTNLVSNIDSYKGQIAVSPSNINEEGTGNYTTEGINIYKDQQWSLLPVKDPAGNALSDVTSVLFDRQEDGVLWVGTWYYGILKYKDGKLVDDYTVPKNGMPSITAIEPRCGGLTMDPDGNLWFAHSELQSYLGVIKKDGSYKSFSFNAARSARKTFADRNNLIWILHIREGGLTVFKNDGYGQAIPFDPNNPGAYFNYRVLDKNVGNGNLESNSVYSIAEDRDGKICVGTGAGLRVFYNAPAMFSGGDFDAQPIKIVQDGNVELLLANEKVTAIAIDGANNKWVGTESGGAYCFSPDGVTQLQHFTAENSPLYSNSIIDINYDETTGDVFFGTDYGIQSYRSVVIAGTEQYDDLHAFPNPVKPGYQGPVYVRGLVDNSVVKITDESGNLVWETKSTGGQVSWPVTTLSGSRVTTGVYIVYATTTNGELRSLTKVLVVN
jgi:hypothetical protein